MNLRFTSSLAIATLIASGTAQAGDPVPTAADESREELEARVKALEEGMPSWLASWVFKGDLRYRLESIDEEGDPERHRHRVRARIFAGVQVNDRVNLGFQLATTTDNPVSTNQTLGNGWSGTPLRFDLAYAAVDAYDCENGWGVDVIGGKMKNPFAVMSKSELIWDSDVRPEGVAAKITGEMGDFDIFANVGGFWLSESSTGADSGLWGAQCGAEVPIGEQQLTFGFGFYDYGNVEGKPVFDYKDRGRGQGNTTMADGDDTVYEEDFDQFEFFAQFETEAADMPVAIFANLVENTAASDESAGHVFGVKVNSAKEPGDWDCRYQYKKLEQNAVLAAFTDSDFGGGGTDSEGHELNVKYALSKGWSLAFSAFSNDVGISGTDMDYQRYQFDLQFKR